MNHNLSRLFYISGDSKPVSSLTDIKFNKNLDEFNANVPSLSAYQIFFHVNANQHFALTTTYPGLLLGAGYSHPALKEVDPNIKNDVGDFQLGFFFDHTTGLPVIPGSSVKGVLKSVFPKKDFSFGEKKLEYIKTITGNVLKTNNAANQNVSFINETNWEEIFFGSVKKKRKHIFHDAYIDKTTANSNIFEDDYITPHTKGIFKNPTPIRFLKVSPGVTFTFQFSLYDYKDENGKVILKADYIKEVFQKILLDFGIGAKRNVGYGQFK